MVLEQWANDWSLPLIALQDLCMRIGVISPTTLHVNPKPLSEAAVSNIVKLEASNKGCRLWRNNVGAYKTDIGFVRYGLANESATVNNVIKSADLIGIRPILITQEHVGRTIGQFLSREIKRSDWTYKNTEREQAQINWASLVISLGGDAVFATGEGTI